MSNRLPNNEYTAWHDTGCNLHRHCLTCPLPRCQYEAPKPKGRPTQAVAILELHARGLDTAAIAEAIGLSRRAVHRALAAQREAS